MKGLNWYWIGLALTVPNLAGGLVAFPFWRKSQPVLGNIAGTVVILGAAFALILREHVELASVTQWCLDQGFTCWPEPSAFTRFAIYAFIGLIEAMVLFYLSLGFEARIRRRDCAPEWR